MPTPVYLERGSKRVFACALDWPGWCRVAKDGESALDALADYVPRYAEVADVAGVRFAKRHTFEVVEEVPGNATTDFGAPAMAAAPDAAPLTRAAAGRQVKLLTAAWTVFDEIAAKSPAELRKGPRGGGRDRDKMIDHVLGAEAAYARTLGIKRPQPALGDTDGIAELREAIVEVLGAATDGTPLVEKGWLPRYAMRRIAWHVLDHAWEMQDRRDV